MQPRGKSMFVCGKAHATPANDRQMYARYNGVDMSSSSNAIDRYFEVCVHMKHQAYTTNYEINSIELHIDITYITQSRYMY